jgi:hypothetical protein
MRSICVLCLLLSCTAYAQLPRAISFQGVLTDAGGNLVPDGNHQLVLKLFDAASNGNLLFVETQTVPVVKGLFNAIIGSSVPLPGTLAFDRAYFLGVTVDGGSELSPRTALTAVPYALRAATADVAQALAPGAGGVVTRLNNLTGDVSITGSGSTTVTQNGNTVLISSTGGTGGTGIQGVQNVDGTIGIQNPSGPVATIGVADHAISIQKIDPAGAQPGQALVFNGSAVQWQQISGGGGVPSVNGVTGPVTLATTGGATLSTSGNTITIDAGAGTGGGSIQRVQGGNGTIDVTNPGGPITTISVKDNGITGAQLADNAITTAKILDGTVSTADLADGSVGASKLNTASPASTGKVLTATAGGMDWMTPLGGGGISGAGASNQLAFWDGSSSLSGNAGLTFASGNVGIGTGAPAHRLSLIGGPGWTAMGWTGALEMANGSALGWQANGSGQHFGVGQSGGGLYFFRTMSNPGTAGSPALYDFVISDAGKVGIGTTVPDQGQLHVASTGGATAVYGIGTGGKGVYGISGTAQGVYGRSTSMIGVYGQSDAALSAGVYGYSAYIGVQGMSSGADANRQAVRGDNNGSATGYAGLFYGNTWVAGTLIKNAGAFRIDHPLDPANRYLTHSFVESPDMKNIYDGIVTTDGAGEATVAMPDWFEALNRDFRYQLTVVGQFAQAIVSREIASNRFTIKTDKPGVKVSWQVTGIRHDAYANARRIPVEEDKPAALRGRYIFPEGYGQDPALFIGGAPARNQSESETHAQTQGR